MVAVSLAPVCIALCSLLIGKSGFIGYFLLEPACVLTQALAPVLLVAYVANRK